MKSNLASIAISGLLLISFVPAVRAAPPESPSARSAAAPAPRQMSADQVRQWQSRMKLMQRQMTRIREAKTSDERARLLREHMRTMLEQMHAMRVMGGGMMSGMTGGGMMGQGKMGNGPSMMGGGAASEAQGMPHAVCRQMSRRMDMMQMMMEQMMGQMGAQEEGHGAGGHIHE